MTLLGLGEASNADSERRRTFEIDETLPAESDELLVHRWRRGLHESVLFEVSRTTGASSVTFADDCRNAPITYLVESGDRIALPVVLTATGCKDSTTTAVQLLPAARLRGELEVPRGAELPVSGLLRIERCAAARRQQGEIVASFPFEIQEKGQWTLRIPTGCFDVRLEAGSFAPIAWRGLQVKEGTDENLGKAILLEGATVSTQVVTAKDGFPIEGAIVDLVPEVRLRDAAIATHRGEPFEALRRGGTAPDGRISLEAAPEGHYYVRAIHPRDQLSFTFAGPFTLRRGDKLDIPRLEIPEPAMVRVELDIAPETFGGMDVQLSLSAMPRSEADWLYEIGVPKPMKPLQPLELGPLPAGLWQLTLYSKTIDYFYAAVIQEVELVPGASQVVRLRPALEPFRGEISIRGEALEAELKFESQPPVNGAFPASRSNDEGEFQVFLPEPGIYAVKIRSKDGTVETAVPAVEFEDPDTVVEIKIPDGSIEGVVTNSEGAPIAGAWVEVKGRLEDPRIDPGSVRVPIFVRSVRTQVDGTFLLQAVPPGKLNLRARKGDSSSGVDVVELAVDEGLRGVRLQVEQGVLLAGRVVDAAGRPVWGAQGMVGATPTEMFQLVDGATFETAADGRFEVRLPPGTSGKVTIDLITPGMPMTSVRRAVGQDLKIRLPLRGGRVRLLKESELAWGDAELSHGSLVLIGEDGSCLPVFFGLDPSSSPIQVSRQVLILPNLAPGTWSIARGRGSVEEAFRLLHGRGIGRPPLAVFVVEPGQTVDVILPPS